MAQIIHFQPQETKDGQHAYLGVIHGSDTIDYLGTNNINRVTCPVCKGIISND